MEVHNETRRDMVTLPYEQWIIYETEKRKIAARNLAPEEFEQEIKKLCERLEL